MRLTRFRTVRGRLLALLVAIALPIAALTALAAITTYRTVGSAIVTSQARAADDFAVRTRVWYRGSLRSLLATMSLLGREADGGTSCDAAARALVGDVVGYRAVLIAPRAGPVCSSTADLPLSEPEMLAELARLESVAPIRPWGGHELARARYGQSLIAGRAYLSVTAERLDGRERGLLLMDPSLLDTVFDLGDGGDGLKVALVSRAGGVVAARGDAETDLSWLPARDIAPDTPASWAAPNRAGLERTYMARMVAEPDLFVIASFDQAPQRAAFIQFLTLLIAPLLTLTLLCMVYLRAIDNHCIRWLRGIESAARARSTSPSARAIVSPTMPADIRSVAEAFNTMIDEQEVRQDKLQAALDDNRFLARELNHRVKNSLQVVQSYIGLTKRDFRGEARAALADAECRVHVLSAAYRFTLADGEMQPVRVDLFLDDVVAVISNLLRSPGQSIAGSLQSQATLSVDRVIPLGFLTVDVAARALRAVPGAALGVSLRDLDPDTVELAMSLDRDAPASVPPKLFAGLLAQIEAEQTRQPQGRDLGAWRIRHRG